MKHNKIGIITFHRSYNCGSIMQAYAMQKVLKEKYGLLPEFIDFSNFGQQELYSIFEKNASLKNVVKNLIRLAFYSRLKNNNKSYEKYINEYLPMSNNKYSDLVELKESKLSYDLYLTGSDQVWNITIQDGDDSYFLPFVKNHPKIAYAVSQGARDIIKHTENPIRYKEMISDFDFLSVREPNGQKWLKDGFGIDSEIVLDPTLLLDEIDYIDAEERTTENLKENGYIFVYATKLNKGFERIIQDVAKKEGLKIVIWQPDTWLKLLGWSKGYILPKQQNPGKYLTLMKHAKYVFTASFHGVVFATQYRRNFWVLKNDGMDNSKDDRILSLLYDFKLTNRLLGCDEQTKDISEAVDYKYFESKILINRKKSFDFLDRAIK